MPEGDGTLTERRRECYKRVHPGNIPKTDSGKTDASSRSRLLGTSRWRMGMH
jgi:hypothetical protein